MKTGLNVDRAFHRWVVILLLFTYSEISAQAVPRGYSVIATSEGDLDNDSLPEKVIVYNTSDSIDDCAVRELRVMKRIKGRWTVWASSRNCVRRSDQGGMMGDPFAGIAVSNNAILVSHEGGSSWKWSYRDTYAFRNGKFILTKHVLYAGKLCEQWDEIDFDLQSGLIACKRQFESCVGLQPTTDSTVTETFIRKDVRITMTKRFATKVHIISPKYKMNIYLE